jgi:hypothetical protein
MYYVHSTVLDFALQLGRTDAQGQGRQETQLDVHTEVAQTAAEVRLVAPEPPTNVEWALRLGAKDSAGMYYVHSTVLDFALHWPV